MADKKLDTQLVNAGRSKKYTLGAVNSVIQRASSLVFDSVEAKKTRNAQSRQWRVVLWTARNVNPFLLTTSDVRTGRWRRLRAVPPAGRRRLLILFLLFVEQGDHVLMTNTAYEPSQDFCSKILSKLGVTTSWFDPLIGADIVKHVQPNTKIVFLESPGLHHHGSPRRSGDCCRRAQCGARCHHYGR